MQFNKLFDQWSETYDQTVAGEDIEYKNVFKHYEDILNVIALRSIGKVLEFGVGTGNLTKRLISFGHEVVGAEPSDKMREIAQKKLPHVPIYDGHFLDHSLLKSVDVHSIVSSYAFHHVQDTEKIKAVKLYADTLPTGGKIVFGDTIFVNDEAHERAIHDAEQKGYHRLADDLRTEYYTTIPIMDQILKDHGFDTHFEQMNDFVWIIEAKKIANH